MDECIRSGVSTSEETLPGRLQLARRAPKLYRRLMKGYVRPRPTTCSLLSYSRRPHHYSFYPTLAQPSSSIPSIPPPYTKAPGLTSGFPSGEDGGPIIDALAAINSGSARAESDFDNDRYSFKPSSYAASTLRRSRVPRVMGKFNHPIPPMPAVRFSVLFLRLPGVFVLIFNFLVLHPLAFRGRPSSQGWTSYLVMRSP